MRTNVTGAAAYNYRGMKGTARSVSESALIRRINRRLRPDGLSLHVSRDGRDRWDLGVFYTVNVESNFVRDKHIDIEELGRELGALDPKETLAE